MRKKVTKLLLIFMLFFLIVILPFNYFLRVSIAHNELKRYSRSVFWQIDQLMQRSEKEIEWAKAEFSKKCLENARVASYISEYRPEVMESPEKAREIADLLGVDEMHFFNSEGVIIAGTHPEYYNYSMHSGSQIEFFLPMLKDKSLELCQDMVPNTAKGKLMQYAAVWQENGQGIVQIGVASENIMGPLKENALSDTLVMMPESLRGTICVIDPTNSSILLSTKDAYIGKTVDDWVDLSSVEEGEITLQNVVYKGHRYDLMLQKLGGYVYLNAYLSSYILRQILMDTIFLLAYLILLSVTIIKLITIYMDRKLVKGLEGIVSELTRIEDGRVDDIHIDTGIQEFDTLQRYINKMLRGMLGSFKKFSMVLEKSNIPIGVYEHNTFYNRTLVNKTTYNILRLDYTGDEQSPENLKRVRNRMQELKCHPVNSEENVYCLVRDNESVYIRMELLQHEESNLYWMMDVSQWWGKLEALKSQRDTDVLTNLYNRRAFYEMTMNLFEKEAQLGYAAVVAVDADRLKQINDIYGHRCGDKYLEQIAIILRSVDMQHSICARVGGDEFAMLLYGYSTAAQLQRAVTSLMGKRDVSVMQLCDGTDVVVRFSVGCAFYPDEGRDYLELIHYADERMYQDKRSRRDNLR